MIEAVVVPHIYTHKFPLALPGTGLSYMYMYGSPPPPSGIPGQEQQEQKPQKVGTDSNTSRPPLSTAAPVIN